MTEMVAVVSRKSEMELEQWLDVARAISSWKNRHPDIYLSMAVSYLPAVRDPTLIIWHDDTLQVATEVAAEIMRITGSHNWINPRYK